jgi:hypothetical protein
MACFRRLRYFDDILVHLANATFPVALQDLLLAIALCCHYKTGTTKSQTANYARKPRVYSLRSARIQKVGLCEPGLNLRP